MVSVRILVEKHCAFVNFERPQAAADALNGLQVSVQAATSSPPCNSLPCRATTLEEATC